MRVARIPVASRGRRFVGIVVLFLVAGFAAAESSSVEVRWQTEVDAGDSAPVVASGAVYVGSRDGAVYAFDADSGRRFWRFQTGDRLPDGTHGAEEANATIQSAAGRDQPSEVSATPVVAEGSVYVGSEDTSFYSLNALTGELNWSRRTGGKITDPAVVAEGVVYFVSHDGMLYAHDGESGSDLWRLDTSADPGDWVVRTTHLPVVHGRTAFTTVKLPASEQSGSLLLAIDPETGEELWRLAVDGIASARPTVLGDTVLFPVFAAGGRELGSSVYAVDVTSGAVRWRLDDPFVIAASPMVLGNRAVFSADKGVFAVNFETGDELWRFDGPVRSSRLLADERTVYVKTLRGVRTSDFFKGAFGAAKFSGIHALDLATGRKRWTVKSKRSDFWMQLLADGQVYVLEIRRILRAFDAASGRKAWSYEIPGSANRRLSGGGGMILLTTRPEPWIEGRERGKLICLMRSPRG